MIPRLDEPGENNASSSSQISITEPEESDRKGPQEPAACSVPVSNSKYLNSPLYRDTWAQMSLRRHAEDLPGTYDIPAISRALREVTDPAEFERLVELEKLHDPAFDGWLRARRHTSYETADLSGYAEDTLGGHIRAFLEKPGLGVAFEHAPVEPRSDIEYLLNRIAGTHDIEHIVTGFGPSLAGEHALSMLNVAAIFRFLSPKLAQLVSQADIFVTAATFKRVALHYPAGVEIMLEAMHLAMTAARSIRMPLFMVQWEDYLDWRVEDIAGDLGFTRGPGDAWAWTDHVMAG